MSEQSLEGSSEQQQDGGEKGGFTPPASQEELNRIISDRVQRERAKYADHATLKAKAAQLDQLEKASQTEAERVAERIAAADAAVAGLPKQVAEQLRAHLVSIHSIPEEDAELFLTAADPEVLLKQVDRLVARQADRKKQDAKLGNYVPREGNTPTVVDSEERHVARSLFGGG